MSADRYSVGRTTAVLVAIPLVLAACPWFTDFKEQPRIEPWEAEYRGDTVSFPGNPQMSVPITGTVAPGYMISYMPTLGALDSLGALGNPVAPTPESVERGRLHYQINCAVCHGDAGAGNGPVLAYGLPVPSLLTPIARQHSDGYLFGIMRNGRGLMPNYRRIPEEHRWDVVNYMRALQGMLDFTASTERAGAPGEGGAAVPGASRTAPTVPVPHFQQPRAVHIDTMPATVAPDAAAAQQGERP